MFNHRCQRKTNLEQRQHDIVLEEYRQLWAYYHRTLDERKNLFDWYLKVIGIPVTAVVILSRVGGVETKVFEEISAYLLVVIGLTGVSLYATYARESANAARYGVAMKAIRTHWKATYEKLDSVLTIDSHRPGPSIKALRGVSIVIINSSILAAAFWGHPLLMVVVPCFLTFVIVHVIVYLWLT